MARPETTSTIVMFMGPPGSGKGTQARMLQEEYGFECVETGALIRSMRADPSPRARRVTALHDAGRLSPPPLVAEIVLRQCRRLLERGQRVVLDGAPRTLYEAERELAVLRADGVSQMLVIVLDVPKPETVKRILRRWICADCRRVTPVTETVPEQCDACGGKLVRRPDDTADVMDRRWEEYTFRTLPVIEFFERQGLAVRIDGQRPIPEVSAAVRDVLQRRFDLNPR